MSWEETKSQIINLHARLVEARMRPSYGEACDLAEEILELASQALIDFGENPETLMALAKAHLDFASDLSSLKKERHQSMPHRLLGIELLENFNDKYGESIESLIVLSKAYSSLAFFERSMNVGIPFADRMKKAIAIAERALNKFPEEKSVYTHATHLLRRSTWGSEFRDHHLALNQRILEICKLERHQFGDSMEIALKIAGAQWCFSRSQAEDDDSKKYAADHEAIDAYFEVIRTYGESERTLFPPATLLCDTSYRLERHGEIDRACELRLKALELDEKLVVLVGDTFETLDEIAAVLIGVGELEEKLGKPDLARQRFERSMEMTLRLEAVEGSWGRTLGRKADAAAGLARLYTSETGCPEIEEALGYLGEMDRLNDIYAKLKDELEALKIERGCE